LVVEMTRVAVAEVALLAKLTGFGEKDAFAPDGRPRALKLTVIDELLVFEIEMV
jgi:hypothetical protein